MGFRVDSMYADRRRESRSKTSTRDEPIPGMCGPDLADARRTFSFEFAAENLFGLAAGTYAPAVADGFYLLLPPLTPGPHTIEFGGTGNLGAPFSVDVVYHLRVGR